MRKVLTFRRSSGNGKIGRGQTFGRNFERQLEAEGCAFAEAFTKGGQGAAQFLGGQGGTMKAKSMAGFPGSESVAEDTCPVLGRDPDAVISDRNTGMALGLS